MEPETIEALPVGHLRHARWRQHGVPPWEQREVSVGELRDGSGRWYVDLIAQIHQQPRAYRSEAQAWAAARRVMQHFGPDWAPEPAYPTAEAQPAAHERARAQPPGR